MAITIKDLPQTTEYILLKEAKGRKERIKDYINSTPKKYQATKDRITQFWTDNQTEYDKLLPISPVASFQQFFNKYDGEQDLIDLIKPEVIKEIDELLKEKPGDSDIIKELKAIYNLKGHKDLIPQFITNSTGGVSYLFFLTDLIRDYYLKDAAEYISKKLTENDIKISELDQGKWVDYKGELFINIYSNLSDDKEESDLDATIDGINEATGNIKDFIVKTRQTKESNLQDDLNDLKEQIKTLTESEKKLKEEKKEIVKTAGEATARITTLENENAQLKKDLAAKPAPGPTPGPVPTGGESEEWIAVCKFLTESEYYKATDLFNKLYNKNWTEKQKRAIYKMFFANDKNSHWVRTRWEQHFNN